MKRLFKYLFRFALAMVALLVLVLVLLYLPPVQDFIRKQAVKYASSRYDLQLHVGVLRIGFPLNLRIEDIYAGKTATDTLLAARSIRLDVGLRHVLKGEIALDGLALDRVKFVLPGDSVSTYLHVNAGHLTLEEGRAYLKTKKIEAGVLTLSEGNVFLRTGESNVPDTVAKKNMDWTFAVGQIALDKVDFRMETSSLPYLGAGIAKGEIRDGMVSLGMQTVNVGSVSIDGAWCDLQTAAGQKEETAETGKDVKAALADTSRSDWTVTAATLAMQNSSFSLTTGGEKKAEIILSGIGVRIDSVYNRGQVVRASLRDLQVVQKNGVEVSDMGADVVLDTALTDVANLRIHTLHSTLGMNVRSNTSVSALFKEIPLTVTLQGSVGLADLIPFYPHIPARLVKKVVNVNTAFSLSSGQVKVDRLVASMAGNFEIKGNGTVSSYKQWKKAVGNFKLQGNFPDVTFLNGWLVKGGVTVPRGMTFNGTAKASRGVVDVSARFCQGTGCCELEANYNIPSEIYDISLNLGQFALNRFLPADSLGMVSADIRLAGRNLSWPKAEAGLEVELYEFDYKRHPYRNVRLAASLQQTHLKGEVKCPDPDSEFELSFSGDSIDGKYQAVVKGLIGNVDLQALNLMQHRLDVGLGVNIRAAQGKEGLYELQVGLDSIHMTDSLRHYQLGGIALGMESRPTRTTLDVVSGDFSLSFRSDTALTEAVKMFGAAGKEIGRQIAGRDVDLREIQPELPKFALNVESRQNNTVAKYLKARNIGFRQFAVTASSLSQEGLKFSSRINGPYYGAVRLDSIVADAWQRDSSLAYAMVVGGSIDPAKGAFNVKGTGDIVGNHSRFELIQKDAMGEIGFNLGVRMTLSDSLLAVNFFPMNPILGYQRWSVNPDNRIEIRNNKKVEANLEMISDDKQIILQSLGDEGEKKDRLQITIKGVDLGAFTRLMPFAPDLAGVLNTDVLLYGRDQAFAADGEVEIKDFYYQKQRVGTVDLLMKYSLGQHFVAHAIDFELRIDSLRRAVATGEFSTAENDKRAYLDMDISEFPLQVVNAFMPDNLIKLQGSVEGNIRFRGTLDNPQLEGGLAFRNGRAEVVMLGTTFGLDTSRILIRDNKISFNRYRFIAPNQNALSLNGDIHLLPFDRMRADLSIAGKDFQVVNVKQNPSSLVFGKAYVDLNARLAGTFSALSLTGNVNLLNNTAITYTLRNSDPQLQDKSIDLVRFVSFRDTTLSEEQMTLGRVKVNSFVLKMLLEIGSNVTMNVDLSEDGKDNIQIQGGGNLILAMNPESGLTLAGKYILTSGVVTYNVPVAGKKVFNIQNGSYVEWTGNVMAPRLNISASEQVKATVEDGDRNRLVTFESIIRIQNTLSQPEITFDLSAPNDMVIQNQLATFSPEERTKQAMNLLIYGTYTGPGAVSSGGGNVANNALYGFVENELNKYTRKTGLTFGFDSYNTDEQNTRTDFTYQFSKQLFNDKVRVKIGGRVSSDSGDGNTGNVEDNLVDDISIEYVFTKKRNLFLKVFRHSNYESVLEGEVTQTGIGIVWRKNFRKLKDLFLRKSKQENVKEKQKVNP